MPCCRQLETARLDAGHVACGWQSLTNAMLSAAHNDRAEAGTVVTQARQGDAANGWATWISSMRARPCVRLGGRGFRIGTGRCPASSPRMRIESLSGRAAAAVPRAHCLAWSGNHVPRTCNDAAPERRERRSSFDPGRPQGACLWCSVGTLALLVGAPGCAGNPGWTIHFNP